MENLSDAMAAFFKGTLNGLVFINMKPMRVGYGLDWPLDETKYNLGFFSNLGNQKIYKRTPDHETASAKYA